MRAIHYEIATHGYPAHEFRFSDPQRKFSDKEDSVLLANPHLGQAVNVFHKLVRFRTPENKAYPYKYQLLALCGLGNHTTLDKHLGALKAVGLIACLKFTSRDSKTKKFHTTWRYSFPFADQSLFVTFGDEKDEPAPDAIEAEPLLNFSNYKSGGLINKNSIPEFPAGDCGKLEGNPPTPPPPALITEPQVTNHPVIQAKESAVFFERETEEETPESEPPQPIHTDEKDEKNPEPKKETIPEPTSAPVELIEDREKAETQIISETREVIFFIKKEKSDNPRVRTLGEDVTSLERIHGSRAILAGLKCLKEALPTVQNPGGWLRVHLQNPTWLNRFVKNFEERRSAETAHVLAFQIAKKKQAEEEGRIESERLEQERVERFLLALPRQEQESLAQKARERLEKSRAFITPMILRCHVRLLVRERYFAGLATGGQNE